MSYILYLLIMFYILPPPDFCTNFQNDNCLAAEFLSNVVDAFWLWLAFITQKKLLPFSIHTWIWRWVTCTIELASNSDLYSFCAGIFKTLTALLTFSFEIPQLFAFDHRRATTNLNCMFGQSLYYYAYHFRWRMNFPRHIFIVLYGCNNCCVFYMDLCIILPFGGVVKNNNIRPDIPPRSAHSPPSHRGQ